MVRNIKQCIIQSIVRSWKHWKINDRRKLHLYFAMSEFKGAEFALTHWDRSHRSVTNHKLYPITFWANHFVPQPQSAKILTLPKDQNYFPYSAFFSWNFKERSGHTVPTDRRECPVLSRCVSQRALMHTTHTVTWAVPVYWAPQ